MTSDGTFNYTYDDEGNTLTKTKISNDEVTTNTWDHRNRLTKVEVRASGKSLIFEERYTYDVFNRRIGVWTDADGSGSNPGVQMWTAYDHNHNAWADFDGNGDMVMRYLNGQEMDQRFARYDEGTDTAAFYLTDNINSVRQVVDLNGNEIYRATYSAFGMIASQSGNGGDRFTYTGRELDATGQHYYRARYYGAGVGRFASEDPMGFAAGDANLYRYVKNEATKYTDAGGMDRRIGGWFIGHGYIEIRNPDGKLTQLHFGPSAGYLICGCNRADVPLTVWIPSSPAQDQQLIDLWKELEAARRRGDVPGWMFNGFVPSPLYNCWTPVIQLFDFGLPQTPPPKPAPPIPNPWAPGGGGIKGVGSH